MNRSPSALLSSSRSAPSQSSHSDAPLLASSSAAGTVFPTSREARKFSTAWLHLRTVKSLCAFHHHLPFPVSFHTSFRSVLCCFLHFGHMSCHCADSGQEMDCRYPHHDLIGRTRVMNKQKKNRQKIVRPQDSIRNGRGERLSEKSVDRREW